jgi:hypothetical protein
MIQIDIDKPARCIDCPLCVDYDCIIHERITGEYYNGLNEQYAHCPLIPEAVTARVKRSLPPAPEPTKSPERCSPGTAVRLAQHKYDQVTRYIKYKRTGRKMV